MEPDRAELDLADGQAVGVNRDAEQLMEIRVHGIGNHDLWSALGSPRIIRQGSKRRPTLARPPERVDHDLILVNWSRMSRRAPGILWYLAFPFTLINVAYAMRPSAGWRRAVHVAAVAMFSLVLTVLVCFWTIALFEFVFQLVDLPDAAKGSRRLLTIATAVLVLASVVGFRARRSESNAHVASAAMHITAAVLVGVIVWVAAPTQWQVNEGSWARFLAQSGPTDADYAFMGSGTFDPSRDTVEFFLWFDPMAAISYGSLALCLLGALALSATRDKTKPGPASGAVLALLMSGVLTNLIASSALVGTTELLAGIRDASWLPVFGDRDRYDPTDTVVMGRFGRSYATTLLPGVTLLALLIVLILLIGFARPKVMAWFPPKRHRAEYLRWGHRVVGTRLPRVVLAAGGGAIIAFVGLGWSLVLLLQLREITANSSFVDGIPQDIFPTYFTYVGWLVSGSAVIAFYAIRSANSLPAWRETLAKIGDVAGFWPITVQPLGARTYRDDATDGIRDALAVHSDVPRVLVGHSQGSVLAAWSIYRESSRHPNAMDNPPRLVTCGSPLQSLYATFFPQTFTPEFFTTVADHTRGWANFWRGTDPIAVPIASDRVRNIEIDDPPDANTPVRGHSDYWIEAVQKRWISEHESVADPHG